MLKIYCLQFTARNRKWKFSFAPLSPGVNGPLPLTTAFTSWVVLRDVLLQDDLGDSCLTAKLPHLHTVTIEFLLNVFTEFREFSDKNLSLKRLKPATFRVGGQDATTASAIHMWETLNWTQFMLQWFVRFPKFAQFTESNEVLLRLGKTVICFVVLFHPAYDTCISLLQTLWESLVCNDYLDETYPDTQLNPTDPYVKAKQRIVVERWGKVGQCHYSGGFFLRVKCHPFADFSFSKALGNLSSWRSSPKFSISFHLNWTKVLTAFLFVLENTRKCFWQKKIHYHVVCLTDMENARYCQVSCYVVEADFNKMNKTKPLKNFAFYFQVISQFYTVLRNPEEKETKWRRRSTSCCRSLKMSWRTNCFAGTLSFS